MAKKVNVLLQLHDKMTKPLKAVGKQTDDAKKKLKQATNAVKAYGNRANSVFTGMVGKVGKVAGVLGTLGGVLTVAGLKAWCAEAEEASQKQTMAVTKLNAVLANVPSIAKNGAAGIAQASKNIQQLASEIQNVGVIGDEVTLAGVQQLATYQLSEKSLKTLSSGMDDLIAQQYGLNATQENAVSIGKMIGKAMSGQTSALSRAGIIMSDTQAEIMKTGNEEKRAATLAEILKQNVGGVNKALAETDDGKIQQVKNAYGDMTEVVGEKILHLKAQFAGLAMDSIPVIQDIAVKAVDKVGAALDKVSNWINTHQEQIKSVLSTIRDIAVQVYNALSTAITWVINHGNILIPVLAGVVSAFAAFNVLNTAATALKSVASAMQLVKDAGGMLNIAKNLTSPLGIAVLAIGAAVTAGMLLYKNWDKIKAKAIQIGSAIKQMFTDIKDAIVNAFDKAKEKLTAVFDAIKQGLEDVPILGKLFAMLNDTKVSIGASHHALGTPYFSGGLTHINERGGEIVNLPNGTKIIPHDVSKKTINNHNGKSVVVNLTIQGNVIGNQEYMERTGEYVANKLLEVL